MNITDNILLALKFDFTHKYSATKSQHCWFESHCHCFPTGQRVVHAIKTTSFEIEEGEGGGGGGAGR